MDIIKRTVIALIVLVVGTVHAQEKRFTITGEMECDSLRFTKDVVKTVFLTQSVGDQTVTLDSANVENGKFCFTGVVPQKLDVYEITGFDNGGIQIFLEEGDITITQIDARFPTASYIGGTSANKVYQEYKNINSKAIKEGTVRMKEFFNSLPEEIANDSEAHREQQSTVFYSNNLYTKIAIIDFVYKNIDSPVALYIIKYSLFPMFTPKVIERQFMRAVPDNLHNHHMYKEVMNQIRAAELKVGNIAPDITGFTTDGKEISLSDLKGKYVLLDFWASWCAPCRREFPFIKEALTYSEKNDKFVVLSYSIDSKEKDWKNCIEANALTHSNWLHISALKGWSTEAAKLFNVEGVPYTVLLSPEGRVIAFELRGDAMVKKIKNIIDGVEDYK